MMKERECMRVPTGNEGEAIAVMELKDRDGQTWLELRFQQELAEIGWTTQRRIRLDAAHVSSLQAALALFTNAQPAASLSTPSSAPRVVCLEEYRRRAS